MMARSRAAFTLVEMLVVIGIIAVLVALLVPVTMMAVRTTRDARMSIEIGELEKAIETYKLRKGDYPPSMGEIDWADIDGDGNRLETMYQPALRYYSICERHLKKCYPKLTQQEKDFFYDTIAPRLNQSEALFFWLSQTRNDERNPFTSAASANVFYEFREENRIPTDPIPLLPDKFLFAVKPDYAKDSPYIYLDGRHCPSYYYAATAAATSAIADPTLLSGGRVQPYFDDKQPVPNLIHSTKFQILCAGQDGEFGAVRDLMDANGVPLINNVKRFTSGVNYTDEDKDNLTNFGNGKRLGTAIPGA